MLACMHASDATQAQAPGVATHALVGLRAAETTTPLPPCPTTVTHALPPQLPWQRQALLAAVYSLYLGGLTLLAAKRGWPYATTSPATVLLRLVMSSAISVALARLLTPRAGTRLSGAQPLARAAAASAPSAPYALPCARPKQPLYTGSVAPLASNLRMHVAAGCHGL